MADDRTSTAVNGRAAVVDLIYLGFTLQLLLPGDRKSTRLNSSHSQISNAVFCLRTKPTSASGRIFGQRIPPAAGPDAGDRRATPIRSIETPPSPAPARRVRGGRTIVG